MVQPEPPIAFATRVEPAALEIRVNFGLFAGREATRAELDQLAHGLVDDVGEVSVVAEQRHEVSEDSEVTVHQVRIDIDARQLPDRPAEREKLTERLVAAAEFWARACIDDRHAEISEV